jgi:hypothetical protein
MKALLIDPFTKTVTETEVAEGLDAIYKAIDADGFDVIYINSDNCIFVDEYGLSRKDRLFRLNTYHQPLAGKGLVLGVNAEGDSCDTSIDWEAMKRAITFPDLQYAGSMPYPEGATVDHPLLGPNTPVIGSTPIFVHRTREG